MEEQIKQQIEETFGGFTEQIDKIVKYLTETPKEFNEDIWNLIVATHDVLLPIGISLAVLFFVMDFLNKSVHFEFVKWETVAKVCMKFIIIKVVVQNSLTLMTKIFTTVNSMIDVVWSNAQISGPSDKAYENLIESVSEMDTLEQFGFFASFMPFYVIILLMRFGIYIIVYGRIIEIYIRTALAPIPIATLMHDSFSQTGINFFKSYMAVCIQGFIILMGILIYNQMMVSQIFESKDPHVWEMIGNMIITTALLLFVFAKSGTLAKSVMGAN